MRKQIRCVGRGKWLDADWDGGASFTERILPDK